MVTYSKPLNEQLAATEMCLLPLLTLRFDKIICSAQSLRLPVPHTP